MKANFCKIDTMCPGLSKGTKCKPTDNVLRLTSYILAIVFCLMLASAVWADPQQLRTGLEEDGFYVQQGVFYEFDTVKLASQGKLLSCFGNNAGSAYLVFSLPAAPDQDTSLGSEKLGWPDEISSAYDDPDIENTPANPYFAPGGRSSITSCLRKTNRARIIRGCRVCSPPETGKRESIIRFSGPSGIR